MVSRVSSRRWFLRDLPQTIVVLVRAAFAVSILINFADWSAVRHETAATPELKTGKNGNDEQLYSGSIILPTREELCWQGMVDNRTGRMIDKGSVNCDKAAYQLAGKNPPAGTEVMRLHAISKAFHHESD